MKILSDSKKIREVLDANIDKFVFPAWIRDWDNNLNPPHKWDTAKKRILLVFLSPGRTRSVSNTDTILNNIIKSEFGDKVFVDCCYFPERLMMRFYERYGIPYMLGNVSQRPFWDYDLIMMSNSLVNEKANVGTMLSRSGCPLWHDERMKNKNVPLIMLGGCSADHSECLYGRSKNGEHYGLVDFTYIGPGEGRLKKVLKTILFDKLHPKKSKEKIIRSLIKKYDNIYYPYDYEMDYHTDKFSIKTWKYKPSTNPRIVKFYRPSNLDLTENFDRKIFHSALGEDAVTAGELLVSHGCSSGGACTFCHEGSVYGRWREKSLVRIREDLKSLKKYTQASRVSFFSFNLSFLSYYIDLAYEAASFFPSISYIGMRADTFGADSDYTDVSRMVGRGVPAVAMEGISERIRNGYLNKNLSEDELFRCLREQLRLGRPSVKFQMIMTGLEDESDYAEFKVFLDKLVELREDFNLATHFMFNFTALQYFKDTPLQWEKRRSTLGNYRKERPGQPLIDILDDYNGIQVRFTSEAMSPTFTQLILDIGRPLTAVFEQCVEEGIFHASGIMDDQIQRFCRLVELEGISIEEVFKERPSNYIFPGEWIHCMDRDYLRKVWTRIQKGLSTPSCLRTVAKTDNRKCVKCGVCSSPTQIKEQTGRAINNNERTPIDVQLKIQASRRAPYLMKMAFDVNYNGRIMSKNSIGRYAVAKIMSALPGEGFLNVSMVGRSNFFWIERDKCYDYTEGEVCFDVLLKKKISEKAVMKAYDKVKKEIVCSELKYALYHNPDKALWRSNFFGAYMIVFDHPTMDIKQKASGYDGTVSLPSEGHIRVFKKAKMSIGTFDILYRVGKDGKGYMFAKLPVKVSPFYCVMGMLSRGHSYTLSMMRAKCLYTGKESDIPCEICGNKTTLKFGTASLSRFCPSCEGRTLLSKV